MRYRAVISYYGARYVGWQRQKNGLSVQEELEKAMEKALKQKISTTASGRTDAGVHAEGQVIHFDAETSVPADKIPFAVNAYLPNDVSVLSCQTAPEDFNARFCAKRKTYCYKLYLSRQPRPMLETTHAHIVVPLDSAAMRQAADVIEGEHDFKCFQAAGSHVKGGTVRKIFGIELKFFPFEPQNQKPEALKNAQFFECKPQNAQNGGLKGIGGISGNLTKEPDEAPKNPHGEPSLFGTAVTADKSGQSGQSGQNIQSWQNVQSWQNAQKEKYDGLQPAADLGAEYAFADGTYKKNGFGVFDGTFEIYVTGNGFLYNMVRIISGTLVYAGLHKLNAADIAAILETGDRTAAGKTLPAHGLHLIRVDYR